MARIATALVLLGAIPVHAQAPGIAAIRGRVVAAETGQPIPFARVALIPSSSNDGLPDSAFTNSDGWFQLTGVTTGRYTASATKTGYVTARFGAHTPFDRPVDVVVQQATEIDRIDSPTRPCHSARRTNRCP